MEHGNVYFLDNRLHFQVKIPIQHKIFRNSLVFWKIPVIMWLSYNVVAIHELPLHNCHKAFSTIDVFKKPNYYNILNVCKYIHNENKQQEFYWNQIVLTIIWEQRSRTILRVFSVAWLRFPKIWGGEGNVKEVRL